MPELYTAVAGETISYEGLFNMSETFRIIDKYYRLKGFDKLIIFDEQYDTEKGRYVHVKAEYYKKTDAYVRISNRLWIYANNLRPVEKVIDGEKISTHHGKLAITFDGFLQTEYFGLVPDNKPLYFIIRVLYESFLAKPRILYWNRVIRHVVNEIKTEVSGYLNLNRFLYER